MLVTAALLSVGVAVVPWPNIKKKVVKNQHCTETEGRAEVKGFHGDFLPLYILTNQIEIPLKLHPPTSRNIV